MTPQWKISFFKGIPLTTGQCALAFATGIFELDHGEEGKYLKTKNKLYLLLLLLYLKTNNK